MKEKKKALAVVAGPYRFYQVLWLYTQFQEYEWDIMLLPFGGNDIVTNKIQRICNELGIFRRVYRSNIAGERSTLKEQFRMFLRMLFYYVAGQRKRLMCNILKEQTGGEKHDVFFIGCESSIMEGAIIGLAKEEKVYMFEEGLGDYLPKKKYPSIKIKEILCFLIAKMGYFSPYFYFELKNTKYCIKYATLPELIRHREYVDKLTLFQGSTQTTQQFQKLLEEAYSIKKDSLDQYDVILFTSTLGRKKEDNIEYVEKLHKWLYEHYRGKKILIKKHPRDEEEYSWDDLKCTFYQNDLPAEIFIELIHDQDIVMMGMTTIMLSLLQKMKNMFFIHFDGIHGDYERNIKDVVNIFDIENDRIVHL